MGEVFADPVTLRGLAADLDRARDQLATLMSRARGLGAADAVAGLVDLPGWALERALVLRRSAGIVEALEARTVDWVTVITDPSLLQAAGRLGYSPLAPLPGQGHLPGLAQVLAGLPGDAGAARRSQAVAAWWAQLSTVEQVAVVTEAPDAVGNLDGIDFGARDQANRIRLRQAHADLAAHLPFAPPGVDPLARGVLTPQNVHLDDATWERIRTLQAIESTIALDDRHLVTFDLAGGSHAQAAVAIGDLETAANVAVFTPGLTTTVAGSLADYDARMSSLNVLARRQAARNGKPTSVATVSWIGYDAPQWNETLDPAHTVAMDHAARTGAVKLNGFYAGLDATRTDDPHVTALGHSYGSLTTSIALQRGRTGADDAILFGSPGLDTSRISDLHVPAGHVFVLEARRDPVADLATFGPDPNQLDGVTNLSTAHAMTAEGERTESVGHSAYLTDDSTSQFNIASVVAGVPEQAVRGRQVGVAEVLNHPFTRVDRWLS